MPKKKKITLTNTLSNTALDSLDDMIDDSMESTIDDVNIESENIDNNGEAQIKQITIESLHQNDDNNDITDKNIDIFNIKDKICPFKDTHVMDYTTINDKLIEIYNDFVSDTSLTPGNISYISQNEAYIKARWCSKLLFQKKLVKDLKAEYNELKERIKQMVTEKSASTSFLKQKMNIDSIVSNDVNLKELAKKIEEAEMIKELYTYYYDIIKGMGYQIRNSIDCLNFERGI